MATKAILLLAISSGLMQGCSESEDTAGGVPDAAFLEASELTRPSDTSAIEEGDLLDVLQANLDLFQPTGSGGMLKFKLKLANMEDASFEKFQACIETILNQNKIAASGEQLKFAANADFTSCLDLSPQTVNGSRIEFKEFKTKLFLALSCSGKDLSSYNGKTWTEYLAASQQESFCSKNGSVLINTQSVSVQSLVQASDGKTTTIKSVNSTAFGSGDSDPCTIQLQGEMLSYAAGCHAIELTSSTGGTSPRVDYFKREFGDVSWKDTTEASWYNSGTMAATINNWSGSIIFAGATTNPQYVLNNGTKTVEGRLGFGLR